ncbi:hypothetical protein MN0502_10000 [Arthrobacter sp. MN05-02]|nr:hypothetical protein MN0502_10000 [Arthrobacter sp. MN05-02]
MSYGLSIDVGTSFTAAAVIRTDSDGPEAPRVLPLGSRSVCIPTVVFLAADGTRLVGEVAERRGLSQPERVTREFKRRMGDVVPLMVGDVAVLPQDLFAAVVAWVVGVATEREGEAPEVITLTHPVGWGEHRTSLLEQALTEAGIGEVVLMTEPEAAALSYASREHVACGSTLAVYDLGGGTFDATVIRKTDADSFSVLGVPQGIERLGGADFDQEIFTSVLGSAKASFTEPEPGPEILAALSRLRRECAEAKEALSADSEATISVMIPGAHAQVRLVRSEFEAMIEPAVAETVDTLRAALESAEVDPEDLSAILLIGGSSRIPLVAQILSSAFDRPLAIDVDPKASVALGAAFATAALEDASGPEGTAPDRQDDDAVADGPTGRGVPPRRTNAAGFSLPRRQVPAPRHGPASTVPNRRLGLRVGVIAAAVALLGVTTATATNAPNPLAALSALGGDQRAEAAEEPRPTPSTGEAVAEPGEGVGDGGAGPLLDAEADQNFLEKAGVQAGAAPGPGVASPAGTPSAPTEGAGPSAGQVPDPDEGVAADTPAGTPAREGGATPAPAPSAAALPSPGRSPVRARSTRRLRSPSRPLPQPPTPPPTLFPTPLLRSCSDGPRSSSRPPRRRPNRPSDPRHLLPRRTPSRPRSPPLCRRRPSPTRHRQEIRCPPHRRPPAKLPSRPPLHPWPDRGHRSHGYRRAPGARQPPAGTGYRHLRGRARTVCRVPHPGPGASTAARWRCHAGGTPGRCGDGGTRAGRWSAVPRGP